MHNSWSVNGDIELGHGMYSIEVGPANINDLNSEFSSIFKGWIPREALQSITTAFPSRLQELMERHDVHVESVIFTQ